MTQEACVYILLNTLSQEGCLPSWSFAQHPLTFYHLKIILINLPLRGVNFHCRNIFSLQNWNSHMCVSSSLGLSWRPLWPRAHTSPSPLLARPVALTYSGRSYNSTVGPVLALGKYSTSIENIAQGVNCGFLTNSSIRIQPVENSEQGSCVDVFGKAPFLYMQILPSPGGIMQGIFFWCSLALILYSLNSQLTSVEGMLELAHQYLVTPHGTISWNVDEEMIDGRIKPASPEPRSILASLKWYRWTVGPPDRLWHRAHVTPIRHPYQEKMNLNVVDPAELVLCMRKR